MRNGALVLAAALALATAACSDANGATTVDVYAASSLTDLFGALEEQYVDQGGDDLRLNFASSSALANQILEGAPADIFASANIDQVLAVNAAGHVATHATFATTTLAVAVGSQAPHVQSFADLAEPGVLLVLAAPGVPAGDYAREVLQRANGSPAPGDDFAERVLANVRSDEPNVRAALARVELGEADAAIVYRTDLHTAGDIRAIDIPAEFNVRAAYEVALLDEADPAGAAKRFFEFLQSAEAAAILRQFGFDPVEPGS